MMISCTKRDKFRFASSILPLFRRDFLQCLMRSKTDYYTTLKADRMCTVTLIQFATSDFDNTQEELYRLIC